MTLFDTDLAEKIVARLDRLVELFAGGTAREKLFVGGPPLATRYARTKKVSVPSSTPVLVQDESPRARYRLLQVTGADGVRLEFTERPTGTEGLLLNAGDAYEMAPIFNNLVVGKIWAYATGAATEVTVTEIGE